MKVVGVDVIAQTYTRCLQIDEFNKKSRYRNFDDLLSEMTDTLNGRVHFDVVAHPKPGTLFGRVMCREQGQDLVGKFDMSCAYVWDEDVVTHDSMVFNESGMYEGDCKGMVGMDNGQEDIPDDKCVTTGDRPAQELALPIDLRKSSTVDPLLTVEGLRDEVFVEHASAYCFLVNIFPVNEKEVVSIDSRSRCKSWSSGG